MFRLSADVRVYLHRDPIDFRAGIDSLAILVEQSMGLSPFERAVFVFCNRRRTRMRRSRNPSTSQCLEPADPAYPRSDREDLRDMETKLRPAPYAMARACKCRRSNSPDRHRLQYETGFADHCRGRIGRGTTRRALRRPTRTHRSAKGQRMPPKA